MFKRFILAMACSLLLTSCDEPIQLAPDAVLPNGGVYQGEIQDGLFHGKGTIRYPSGSHYDGLFKEGVYHGQGTLVFSDGSEYQGEFSEGRLTGKFVVESSKESLHYEGDLLDGYMHGQGTLTTDGYTYIGGFKDRMFEGFGKITYENGVVYEGAFLNGLYDGEGMFLDDEGGRYEGQFKDNYYHGVGKIVYQNGSVYEGGFKAGQYHGHGRYSLNEAWYEGEYADNQLNGQSEYLDDQGNRYKGETKAWRPAGQGELVQADGTMLKGVFAYGSLEGIGEKTSPDGSHYKGGFQYNEYDGVGVLTNVDGSVYEGNFSYGNYHGHGKLTMFDEETGKKNVLEGRWRNGKLAYNSRTGERQHIQAEIALEKHQALLSKSLSGINASEENTNVYFLGVAGDGRQSVFRREVEFVSEQIKKRYNTQGRSILLVNHHDTAELYPMATSRSIASAIASIGEKMNNEDDVLFLYLTSHGSKNHDFYLNHDSIRLPDISPKELKVMLDRSKIKWKIILVSACYSGGFIAELKDKYTLLMTAADANSQSFGCSEESEMTYFAKAVFKEVFSKTADIKLAEAFYKAKEVILAWETEQELDASNPMMSAPKAIVEKMASF